MSKNQFAAGLVALLFVMAALCAWFAERFAFGTRDLRRLQPQVAAINGRLNVAQSLLNDTLEYSKRNPTIDPLLQSLMLKTNSTIPAPVRPTK